MQYRCAQTNRTVCLRRRLLALIHCALLGPPTNPKPKPPRLILTFILVESISIPSRAPPPLVCTGGHDNRKKASVRHLRSHPNGTPHWSAVTYRHGSCTIPHRLCRRPSEPRARRETRSKVRFKSFTWSKQLQRPYVGGSESGVLESYPWRNRTSAQQP